MTTTITADTGAVSGSAGLKQSADSSGVLALATGTGTTAVTIDASQNVGIGKSSPDVKTDILGGANTALRIASSSSVATTAGSAYCLFGGSNNINSGYLGYVGVANQLTLMNGLVGEITFGTSNTERARIDSSGNLLVGQTTNGASGKVAITTANGASGSAIATTNVSGTAQYYAAAFYNNGTTNSFCGGISVSGTTTTFATSSDYRLKENIAPMTGALNVVAQLKPCTYSWKSTGESTQGFIAHELQEVVPECVVGEKDAVDEEGNPKYQGIDTSFLVATLTAAIQEQQVLITTLTERITALEAK